MTNGIKKGYTLTNYIPNIYKYRNNKNKHNNVLINNNKVITDKNVINILELSKDVKVK